MILLMDKKVKQHNVLITNHPTKGIRLKKVI